MCRLGCAFQEQREPGASHTHSECGSSHSQRDPELGRGPGKRGGREGGGREGGGREGGGREGGGRGEGGRGEGRGGGEREVRGR